MLGREKGKEKLHELIKECMAEGKNILTEETSRKTLNKYIGYYIRKYGYKIIVFQFTVSKETAYKRDVQRGKEKWHPSMGEKWIDETHKYHEKNFDPNGILIDTDKLNKKDVVNFILKKIK